MKISVDQFTQMAGHLMDDVARELVKWDYFISENEEKLASHIERVTKHKKPLSEQKIKAMKSALSKHKETLRRNNDILSFFNHGGVVSRFFNRKSCEALKIENNTASREIKFINDSLHLNQKVVAQHKNLELLKKELKYYKSSRQKTWDAAVKAKMSHLDIEAARSIGVTVLDIDESFGTMIRGQSDKSEIVKRIEALHLASKSARIAFLHKRLENAPQYSGNISSFPSSIQKIA